MSFDRSGQLRALGLVLPSEGIVMRIAKAGRAAGWLAAGAFLWMGGLGTARGEDAALARIEGGDPSVSGAFLRPYTNRWTFSIEPPGGKAVEAGVWTDRMEATTYRGRPAMKRTQVAEYKKGIRLTFVNVFDPATMASWTFDYERSDTGEKRHLEVDDKTVKFRREPGTGSEEAQDYVARVGRRILDFYDGLYGILIDAFPLKEGYETEFAAFDTDRARIDWVRLKVTGRETVSAGEGKSVPTWVVHVETQLYGSSTWWVTREAPFVIRAALVLAEKDGGTKITYTMI
jgi:hypothetical protein